MVFDEEISTTVSLSQILDCFLEDGENPSTIFSFLEMHENEIEDIVKFSCLSPRMFSLDFIKKCSRQELLSLVKLIEKYDMGDEGDCLIWQVFCCKDISNDIKTMFSKSQKELKYRREHPYGGSSGRIFERLDSGMNSVDNGPFDIAQEFNKFSESDIRTFAGSFGLAKKRSLFSNRILQPDVFQYIEPIKQFILLNNLPSSRWWFSTHKGFKQILNLDFHPDMKKIICGLIESRLEELFWVKYTHRKDTLNPIIPNSIQKLIKESKSFNELIMKMQIRGDEKTMDWVMYCVLVIKGLDFIKKCGKTGEKILKEHLDITEIIEFQK